MRAPFSTRSFLLTSLFVLATGCGSTIAPDASAIPHCVPGEAALCACPGSMTGAQICASDGTFGLCSCVVRPDDAGTMSLPDANTPDANANDANEADAAEPEAGLADVSMPEASAPDVSSTSMCVPGMSIACACVDGMSGAQTCGADGTFAACVCVAPPAPDAGTPDVASPCGPGTYPSDAGCLPIEVADGGATYYDLRASITTVTGDGITMLPLLAIGRNADGSPSTADVVFWLTRPGSGTVTPTTRLGTTGTTINFVPCNAAASSACPGPVQVVMALGSAPTVPVAISPVITVTEQVAVGTPAPCLGGGNVAYAIGDTGDYITGGRSYTYRDAQVVVTMRSSTLITAQLGGFGDFGIQHSSSHLGMDLMAQVYEGAVRYPFESAGQPGFNFSGMGRGCNMLTARFQIHTLTTDASGLLEFTSTFEQHCEGGTPAARGCVHWHR